MLMGGKARKYWKVEKIHEQFRIYKKPVKGVSFLNKVPATSDLYECLLKDGAATENMY